MPLLAEAWVPAAVKASVEQGVVPESTHALVISADAIRTAVRELKAVFPAGAIHSFAAKANSLFGFLKLLESEGMACEAASIGEFEMADRVFGAARTVFDSPVKTTEELERALYTPCYLNVDNFQELERVAAIHARKPIVACVGMRVNPQVGMGSIGTLSTGNATSKFGVGLDDYATEIIAAFEQHSFLKMLHLHTGSQGCGVALMAAGVRKVLDFIEQRLPAGRLTTLDIGGGLPVNFETDEWTPSFEDYAVALKEAAPQLFAADQRLQLITEFGRAIANKSGVFLSRVEYTKVNGGRFIVQQHVGADLLVRQTWAPNDWPIRGAIFDGKKGDQRSEDVVNTDVAGPCCLGGDLAVRNKPLPRAQPGDVVALFDLGGYAHSSFSRYNLRQAPAAYLFDAGKLQMIRRRETVAETLAFMMPDNEVLPVGGSSTA